MNMQYLFTRLVLPLLAASALCMFISRYLRDPWEGLAVNMAAAFSGSIVTVLFIDVILQRHQETLWGKVRSKVFTRLERIANSGIASVRGAFGVAAPVIFFANDPPRARQELICLADHVLVPARRAVQGMNRDDWRILALNLQGIVQEVDRMLSMFSRNLSVDYTSRLLEIQEAAMLILTVYTTWPDMLGIPEQSLPPRTDGSSSGPLQRDIITGISGDIERLLAECSQLLQFLPPRAVTKE
jgi:hypothetical protein